MKLIFLLIDCSLMTIYHLPALQISGVQYRGHGPGQHRRAPRGHPRPSRRRNPRGQTRKLRRFHGRRDGAQRRRQPRSPPDSQSELSSKSELDPPYRRRFLEMSSHWYAFDIMRDKMDTKSISRSRLILVDRYRLDVVFTLFLHLSGTPMLQRNRMFSATRCECRRGAAFA